MDKNKYLIILKNKDKTEEVREYKEDKTITYILFNSSTKTLKYNNSNVKIYKNPKEVSSTDYLIYKDGKIFFDIKKILIFSKEYLRIFWNKGGDNYYKISNLMIKRSALMHTKKKETFEYLLELAQTLERSDEEDRKKENKLDKEPLPSLYTQYKKITYIDEESILAKYLEPEELKIYEESQVKIFPFGFNLSQEKAVTKALTNQISIIEGPPGTGKTQTILNILVNLMMDYKTVAVSSNNNTAVENIFDKLKENDLSFFVAKLGKKKNKEIFFETQSDVYPLYTNIESKVIPKEIIEDTLKVKELLATQNKLAKLSQELDALVLEKKYFLDSYPEEYINFKNRKTFVKITSKTI